MNVLGIHGGITIRQHEPGAAIAVDGRVVAVCEEERYLREKSAYGRLPEYSIRAALKLANLRFEDIDLIVSSGETYQEYEGHLRAFFMHQFGSCPRIRLVHHQKAHVASSFYSSGFDDACAVVLDASGDGKAGLVAHATKAGGIREVSWIDRENSLGLFYTMMTYYLGFTDGDEYKVMGLAPYGKDTVNLSKILKVSDGLWKLNSKFVRSEPKPQSPFEHLYSEELSRLLGQSHRLPGAPMTQFYKDVAASAQRITQDCLLGIARHGKNATHSKNLCLAGGVTLNCSATKHILYSGLFDQVYTPPSPSDRGLALGCAYLGAVECGDKVQSLSSAYLGSAYDNDVIHAEIKANGCRFKETAHPDEAAAELMASGAVIGWFQGRSEMGARALGHRSILADPRTAEMKALVNARIKFREEFRPFAPAALEEKSQSYFDTRGAKIPFMNFAVDAKPEMANRIPATVHVDGTSRLQTVSASDDRYFHGLISHFNRKTDVPVVLNTSFNLKGQPIVESPRDALMTFYGCGLDALVIGNYIVTKN